MSYCQNEFYCSHRHIPTVFIGIFNRNRLPHELSVRTLPTHLCCFTNCIEHSRRAATFPYYSAVRPTYSLPRFHARTELVETGSVASSGWHRVRKARRLSTVPNLK